MNLEKKNEKTSFGLVLGILIAGFLLIGCDLDPKGTAPLIIAFFSAGSQMDCENKIEKTSFKIGDQLWIGYVITDEDKDVVSVTISVSKAGQGQIPITNTGPVSSTPLITTLFYTPLGIFTAGDQGTYSITVYVTDSKGNKSNIVLKVVTVTN